MQTPRSLSALLTEEPRGAVFVEKLIVYLPLLACFFATWELAELGAASIVVQRASAAAGRAAIVVLSDDPSFYDGEDVGAYSGRRREDIELAAGMVLSAIPRFGADFEVDVSDPPNEVGPLETTVTAQFDCGLVSLMCGDDASIELTSTTNHTYQGAKYAFASPADIGGAEAALTGGGEASSEGAGGGRFRSRSRPGSPEPGPSGSGSGGGNCSDLAKEIEKAYKDARVYHGTPSQTAADSIEQNGLQMSAKTGGAFVKAIWNTVREWNWPETQESFDEVKEIFLAAGENPVDNFHYVTSSKETALHYSRDKDGDLTGRYITMLVDPDHFQPDPGSLREEQAYMITVDVPGGAVVRNGRVGAAGVDVIKGMIAKRCPSLCASSSEIEAALPSIIRRFP